MNTIVFLCTVFLITQSVELMESDHKNNTLTIANKDQVNKTGNSSNVAKHRFSSMLSTSKKITNTGDCSFRSDPSLNLALKDHSSGSILITEFISIPVTSFSCFGRQPGYYADHDGRVSCKVFHYCNRNETLVSFLCPDCTLFNDEKQLCDYWYNVECKPLRDDIQTEQ